MAAVFAGMLLPSSRAADPGGSSSRAFYRVEVREGRCWFISPRGELFLSKGVDDVQFRQDVIQNTEVSPYGDACREKYGAVEPWREAVAKRLAGWGVNTLGGWSDEAVAAVDAGGGRHLAYAPVLHLADRFPARETTGGGEAVQGFPDVFDPAFAAACRKFAAELCTPRKDDPNLLGWFTDNELRWGPDWRGRDESLTRFLALRPGTPGREAAVDLLRRRHGDIARFNAVWAVGAGSWDDLAAREKIAAPFERKEFYFQNQEVERNLNDGDPRRAAFMADCDAFLDELAERYFHAVHDAVRAADPNHLILGARFGYFPTPGVVAACARWTDVVSLNLYDLDPARTLARYTAAAGAEKPLLIGEFSFRGRDSGLPNTRGAGPVVDTQAERADAFERYVQAAARHPQLVGYHWFEHADEPREGRFDGENSNYGVVNIRDEPYEVLVRRMTGVNARIDALHAPVPRP